MHDSRLAGTPSLGLRVALFFVSLLIAGGCGGLLVRPLDGNAFPRLRMFETARDGSIDLEPNAAFRLIGSRGNVCEISTGAYGVRVPHAGAEAGPHGSWLAVGDSQVLGFGVDDGDTFAARLT